MTEHDSVSPGVDLGSWDAKAAALDELTTQLAGLRFTGHARSGLVTAEVDGNGRLLDVRVAEEALRRSHPEQVGPDTVQALSEARAAARQEGLNRMGELLGRAAG